MPRDPLTDPRVWRCLIDIEKRRKPNMFLDKQNERRYNEYPTEDVRHDQLRFIQAPNFRHHSD